MTVTDELWQYEMPAASHERPSSHGGHRSLPLSRRQSDGSDGMHDDSDSEEDTEREKEDRRPLIQRDTPGFRDGERSVGAETGSRRNGRGVLVLSEKQADEGAQDKQRSSEMVALLAEVRTHFIKETSNQTLMSGACSSGTYLTRSLSSIKESMRSRRCETRSLTCRAYLFSPSSSTI
jgi:hypothetical protein